MTHRFTDTGAICYYPRIMATDWEFRLPAPRPSEVTRIYYPTATGREQARKRRELMLLSTAEGRLKRLGFPTAIEDIEREALALHETLENLHRPRITPAEAEVIDKLRDAGKLRL